MIRIGDKGTRLNQAFHLGDWLAEPDRHRLSRGDEVAHLQPKMLAVLEVLVQHEGQTVEKNELLDLVWPRQYVFEEVLKRVILKLRQALGDDSRNPRYIETIHKKGYRLLCPVRLAEPKTADSESVWQGGSPFKSLKPFDLEDSKVFFGRSLAVSDAIDALEEQRQRGKGFLLISGASGAGKSSFAMAGLIPELMKLRGLSSNQVTIVDPQLFLDLPQDSEPGKILTLLESDEEQLPASGQQVPILLIDQLEELFLFKHHNEVVERIHQLARSGLIDVIATVREDFLATLNEWPAIARLKQGSGTMSLGSPSQSELAEILQGPASVAGLSFEISEQSESLKRQILTEASEIRQSLPLLQFMLHQMYEQREENMLTWSSYRKLGGLTGAISAHAESTLSRLAAHTVDALPELLDVLTQFDLDNQRVTRRRAALSEISGHPNQNSLAEALVDARLLVRSSQPGGETQIFLVHESLLVHWPQVNAWVEDNLGRMAALRRVRVAYANWLQSNKSRDLLLHAGKSLSDGLAVYPLSDLEPRLLKFIDESQVRARRLRRTRQIAVLALAALTLFSVGAFIVANQQRDIAENNLGLANRATDFVIGLFNTTQSNTSAEALTAKDMLEEGVRRIPVEFADDDANQARLLHASGRLFMQSGELDRAEELLNQAFMIASDGTRAKSDYARSLAELRDSLNNDIADEREDELLKISIENLKQSGATDEELAQAYWQAASLVMPEWKFSPYYFETAYKIYSSDRFSSNPASPEMLVQYATVLAQGLPAKRRGNMQSTQCFFGPNC